MLWGYVNGWFPEYLGDGDDRLQAQLRFLRQWGFCETSAGLDELNNRDTADLVRLGAFLEDCDLHITPMVGFDYVGADDRAAERATSEIARSLERLTPLLRNWTVFTRAGCGHRFDGRPTLAEKLERLSRRLSPLARICGDLGTPLGLNNQGDFYVDDLVSLCRNTPGLFLHLDTANLLWAGEPIHPAIEKAAPFVIATHWRDEKITIGNRKPRGVLLHNCVTGQGDVGLDLCLEILRRLAPNPDRLVMELELFPPAEMDRIEALKQAIAYLRSQGAPLG